MVGNLFLTFGTQIISFLFCFLFMVQTANRIQSCQRATAATSNQTRCWVVEDVKAQTIATEHARFITGNTAGTKRRVGWPHPPTPVPNHTLMSYHLQQRPKTAATLRSNRLMKMNRCIRVRSALREKTCLVIVHRVLLVVKCSVGIVSRK